MRNNSNLVEEIKMEMDQVPIIDTHEHIRKKEDLSREGVSLFTSLKYSILWPDFISAGMPPEQWETNSENLDDAWNKLRPFIDSVQTTSYFRTLMVAYRDLFDFKEEEVNDNNWKQLSDSITEGYKNKDLYKSVFNKLNVEKVLFDVIENPGSLDMPSKLQVFIPTLAIDPLIFVKSQKFFIANPIHNPSWFSADPLGNLLKNWDISYETFDEYLKIIELAFTKLKDAGGVAIKFRFSYFRDMVVQEIDKSEAKKIFNTREESLTKEDVRKIEDYLIKEIIKISTKNDIPIQVHTGLFGNCANDPRKGHPYQLINLFTEFPDTKFILFHGSYPFTGELATVVKAFPNVYLDICWTSWILNNNLPKYLSEWLALIPSNKIMLGGDSECIERAYCSIKLSKHYLAEALADYIERDIYSKKMAINVAKRILRDNAKTIYKV